ncbi:MAG: hypothetical protein IPO26_16560 [Saprospiraceae bacterium]|nr:hypothetical protein [Saprospiraceae bacterium]
MTFRKYSGRHPRNGFRSQKALHEDDPTKRTELLKVLEDGEHKNDEYTHQIFIELGKNFITPFLIEKT